MNLSTNRTCYLPLLRSGVFWVETVWGLNPLLPERARALLWLRRNPHMLALWDLETSDGDGV
jgi:hypothetical protein